MKVKGKKSLLRRPKLLRAFLLVVTLFFLTVLASCNTSGTKPSTIFTSDNVFGPEFPGQYTELSPEEFEEKVKSGELILTTEKGRKQRRQSTLEQFEKDKAFLDALPNKSDALKSLLTPGQFQTTSDGDVIVKLPSGQTVLTLGDEAMYRGMVEAYQEARKPENALSIYRMSYEGLSGNLSDGLPTPDTLKDKSLEEINKALSELNARLENVLNLDGIRPEVKLQNTDLTMQSVVISEGGTGSGNGLDQSGDCTTFASNSAFNRLRWPLKSFITPIKDQANRGTCWAFSAVAAIESRERVVLNRTVNLSEQYFINVHQRGAILDFGDGDWPERALNTFVDQNLPIAFEPAWTYNPASGRTFPNRLGTCNGYTGFCSESMHQSPMSCTRVGLLTFCADERVDYSGSSNIRANRSRVVWENSVFSPTVPVATMRNLLANGQSLIASFNVNPGFTNANEFDNNGQPLPNTNQGYVTDFTNTRLGGHAVLIVGFAPDSDVPFAPTVPTGTGGGFFIIKNSWGCTAGDAGFYYIPVSYVQSFFNDIRVLEMPATRSEAWNDTVEALRPPNLSLIVVGGSSTANLNRDVAIRATLSGGGSGCCAIEWSPAPVSVASRDATYRFTSEGLQTIQAKARTRQGAEVTQEIVINVVNTPPSAQIDQPIPNQQIIAGTSFVLSGFGLDANEGPGPGPGRIQSCSWSIDGGTFTDDPTCNRNATISTVGSHTITMRVLDSQGLSAETSVNIEITPVPTNFPPIVSISSPDAGSTFNDTQTITLTGSATDPEGNTPMTYRWLATALDSSDGIIAGPTEIATGNSASWRPDNTPSLLSSGACFSFPGQRIRLTLEATDSLGNPGTSSREILVLCPPG